jgi:RND family efflux transporter MFP subunit
MMLFGSSVACERSHSAQEPVRTPVPVKQMTAKRAPEPVFYRASGTLRGRATAQISARTTGYVRTLRVKPGDRVKAGDVLIELDARDARALALRARAGLDTALAAEAEARNALRSAGAAAQLSRTTRERVSALFASGSVSQQEFEDVDARHAEASAGADMAEARIRAASSRIAEARAEVLQADTVLEYARVTAPFAGRVIERHVDPGVLASPGVLLLTVEQDSGLRVEVPVEETRAGQLVVGQAALVEVDAAQRGFEGSISEVVPAVDSAARSFVVKVDLPTDDPQLRPGMFARVLFPVGSRERLSVPASAVSARGSVDRVFVVENAEARLRMVSVGEQRAGQVEILAGLSSGERIVLAPPSELRDGTLVMEAL